MNAITAAVIRLRFDSTRGGMSGSRLRRSTTAKAPISRNPAESDGECAGQVECPVPFAGAIPRDDREREEQRRTGQPDVDQEHRLPAEGPREKTAEQHADDEPGRTGSAPDPQCAVARAAFGEGRVDEHQSRREDQGAPEALACASREQHRRSGREPTRK